VQDERTPEGLKVEVKAALIELGWYGSLSGASDSVKNMDFQPRYEGEEFHRIVSIRERDPALREDCLPRRRQSRVE
jgi:hypothetical protein